MSRIQRAFVHWCRGPFTRRTAAVGVLALSLITSAASNQQPPATLLVTSLFAVPLAWALLWIVEQVWERKTRPASRSFSRRQPNASRELREDVNAVLSWDRLGFLFERRDWFTATGLPPVRIARQPNELREQSADEPVLVARLDSRQWWLYQGRFYVEGEELNAPDVKALISYRRLRRKRRLEHAHAVMTGDDEPNGRQHISEEVRRIVFRRDGGRCRQCGSDALLQFDHVIPVALGGSNEPENLQVLCAPCNRAKGSTL